MALTELKTNLKSLRYNKNSVSNGNPSQPYVNPTSINTKPGQSSPDYLLRDNTLEHVGNDITRITGFYRTSQGLLSIAKQNQLSLSSVKTQASQKGDPNGGEFTSFNTLATIAGMPLGNRYNKQGSNPFEDDPTYSDSKISSIAEGENRLYNLAQNKIFTVNPQLNSPVRSGFIDSLLDNFLGESLSNTVQDIYNSKNPFEDLKNFIKGKTPNISKYGNELFRYKGGPGSNKGIGETTIKRTTYSNEGLDFSKNPSFKDRYFTLNGSQIASRTKSTSSEGFDYKGNDSVGPISDFREQLSKEAKKKVSTSINYKRGNIEQRVNLGDPGRRDKDLSSYIKGTGNGPLDKINAYELYKSNTAKTDDDLTDLVKFRIGVIDNKNPNKKTYIHFRALLDNMDDNYSSQWSSEKFMGRGENFYKYGGFERSISLSWTVMAQSREELLPMYRKLNYLASTLAPDYTEKGYMAGNLVTLTVGGYLHELTGIITGLNYSVPQESPWEINIGDQNNKGDLKELPHMIKVSGFNFIPIHDFVPKVQDNKFTLNADETKLTEYGKEKFISLKDGEEPDGYIPNPMSPIKPLTTSILEATSIELPTEISQGLNLLKSL